MKKKLLLASLLACASAATFSACSLTEKLPTWMGGMGDAYYVTITINGEETSVKVAEDAIPEKPQDPVKEGYNFRGWYLDAAGETKYNFDEPLNADSTLYAIFDEKEYVITFVVDGVATPVTFTWSQTPSFETPKKDKYVFKNWCIDEALESPFAFTQPVRADMTVYAKFAEAYKVQYVVTPNLETENEDEINTEIVETEKETAPIKPRDPDVEGYTFEGWFLDKEFTTAYNFDTILEEGQTVYAKLVEKQYTVTYAVVGDEEPLSTVVYDYWDIPEEPETPEHNGEYFFGWYLDTEYTNSYDFSYTLKTDTTIYAQFLESKPVYTLEELIAIKDYPAGNYALQNDISLKLKTWEQIPEFSGKFDGNGYKIYDFTMSTTTANSGFFVTNNGTIKNLTLSSFIFTSNCGAKSSVGVLVAVNNGTIENCKIDNPNLDDSKGIEYINSHYGSSFNAYYGGLVGKNTTAGIIKNCDVFVDLKYEETWTATNDDYDGEAYYTSTTYLGGAIGQNQGQVSGISVELTLSYEISTGGYDGYYGHDDYGTSETVIGGAISENSGVVTQSSAFATFVSNYVTRSFGTTKGFEAGFVNINALNGVVSECWAKGSTIVNNVSEFSAGGFVRYNGGVITDSYADFAITSNAARGGSTGGFVAYNVNEVNRCYALGTINTASTGNVGGFVGYMATNAQAKNSFTSVNVQAANTDALGAFVGALQTGNSSFASCFYSSDATIMKGESAFEFATITGVKAKTTAELYASDFLTKTIYWNFKVVAWVIDGVNAPILVWETAQAE